MGVLDLKAILSLDSSQYEKGLKNAGNAVKSGLGTVAKVGAAAVGAASTAVAGFAASSVQAGANFDKSMSQVAATMGKSMEEMENEVGTTTISVNGKMQEFSGTMREFAQVMGANTAFSASEAADALNYMALAGYDTQTAMDTLPNVLNLAAAGNMDLARASDMVTDTQTAFGISLERTAQMVDEMAKASSTGNTSVEQLGDAFLTVGGLAQELNGGMVTLADGTQKPVDGVQELEIALVAMANAGVKGSEAGTHMRNMLLKLSSPTSAGAKQFEALGVSVFDAEGQMRSLSDIFGDLDGALSTLTQEKKIQAISDLFNTRDLASAEALLNAVSEDWDKIGESILNAEGSAQKMADTQLDNLAGDMTKFKSALEGAQIVVSDQLTPSIRDFVQLGTKGLSEMTAGFNENGLSGAMDALGGTISEGLSMIISGVPKFIEAGGQLLAAIGKGIVENFPAISDAAVEVVTMFVNGLVTGLPNMVNGAVQMITTLANDIADALPTLVPKAAEAIIIFVQGLIENLPEIIEAGANLISGLAQGLVNAIPMIVSKIPELITGITTGLAGSAGKIVHAGLDLLMGIVNAIPEFIPKLVEALPAIITGIIEFLASSSGEIITAGVELLIGLVKAIPKVVVSLVAALPQIISAIVEGLAGGVPKITEAGKTMMSGVKDAIVGFIKEIPKLALDIVTGLANGIADGAKSVVESVKTLGQSILSGIQSFFQMGSPSRLMAEQGRFIDEGLGQGISENANAVTTPMTSLAQSITNIMSNAWGAIQGAASSAWNGITGLLSSAWGAITGNTQTELDGMASSVGASWDSINAKTQNAAAETAKNAVDGMSGMAEAATSEFKAAEATMSENLGSMKSNVAKAWDEIKSSTSSVWEGIKKTLSQDWDSIGKAVAEKVKSIAQGIRTNWEQVNTQTRSAVNTIKTTVTGGWGSVVSETASKWAQVGQQITGQLTSVTSKIPSIVQGIKNAFTNQNWTDVGYQIDKGIADGIDRYSGVIIDAAKRAAKAAYDEAKEELDIKSPSRVMRDKVGKMISLGIAQGIRDEIKTIESAMDDATSYVGNVDSDSADSASRSGGYTQIVNINSPKELSPSEVARQTRNATRSMVYALVGMS